MKGLLILISILPLISRGQPSLGPTIGLSQMPTDNESICTIPWYPGSFANSGLQVGDTAYDFKLYDLNGDSFVLSEKLSHKKPVLLVAGSYTCPVFRNKIATINTIAANYLSQIELAVIYTVEAHPTDTSPYFGYVNVTQANQNKGILYSQPSTYGQRKAICNDLLLASAINVPVLIDGPCNPWWSTYGPAPNNAYLIDTNGIVFAKHDWFDRHPQHDIICDIDSLLGSGGCNGSATGGTFIIQPVNTTVSGSAGEVLYAHANLINTSSIPVNVLIKKTQPNLPADWETAFCYEVCFSPAEDSVIVQIAPNDTADFSLDFFTSQQPDSGSMKVGFRNTDNFSNDHSITFRAWTAEVPLSIESVPAIRDNFTVFPNPGNENELQISFNAVCSNCTLEIFDIQGLLLKQVPINSTSLTIQTENLLAGIYFIRFGGHVSKWLKK